MGNDSDIWKAQKVMDQGMAATKDMASMVATLFTGLVERDVPVEEAGKITSAMVAELTRGMLGKSTGNG